MDTSELPPRFVEVTRLGEGAEGGTWTALDVDAGRRRVVLKRVPADRSAEVRRAFRVLRRVSSPHLPAALELLHGAGGGAWLVTAWIAGEPLARGPVAPAQALAEAVAVAHALRAVHAAGTHHGDVSPGNVLASPQGGLVLTDFGQIGCLGCGTPGFLAPEVLAGGGGPAADVFALGCLICFRLFGASPWTEPEALVDALRRGEAAVAARLAELAAGVEVPEGLPSLLQKLLALDPARRLSDLSRALPRLQALLAACREGQGGSGMALQAGPSWWIPTRWPHVGEGLGPALSLLVPTPRARLVAVVGPPGSGRGRVVEELVGGLQALEEGPAARLCPADRLGAALGVEAASWLDAWLAAGEVGVIGLPEPPPWPGDLAEETGDEEPMARRRAAVLTAAAAMARATLIVPVTPALGLALARARVEAAARGEAAIELVEVRPLTAEELEAALAEVLDPPDEAAAWARGLLAATGGWPGATLATIDGCAAAGLSRPAPEAIARAARGAGANLDAGRARLVLEAAWSAEGQAAAAETGARLLAGSLFAPGGVPLPWALEAARRAFGPRVREMARERLQELEHEAGPEGHGRKTTLALALDAERPAAIEAWLSARGEAGAWERDPALPRLVAWIAAGGPLGPEARARVAAAALRAGQAAQALALAEGAGPRGALVVARALEQTGRPAEALARLDALLQAGDVEPEVGAAALGLRWRALTDLGRAAEAVLEARRVEAGGRQGQVSLDMSQESGAAEAWLWAGLAALHGGAAERAGAWLERAAARLGDPEARPGLAARIEQVRGNLAHVHGQLGAAAAAYERAAAGFERAGEAIGRTLLSANLAALAILGGELARGVEHGRQALRGYLALGRVQALPELAVNLVQLLVRVGSFAEAVRLEVLLTQTLGGSPGALAEARLERVRAELVFAERLHRRVSDAAVAHVYAAAAEALAAAGAGREAAEASLRAAAAARRAGQLARAAELLALAPDDEELRVAAALERALVASASGAGTELSAALASLVDLPRPTDLIARGRLEIAWRYDQVLHAILHPGDPRRPALARRAAATWEALMSKIPDLDKPNVRAALLAESGERAPLGELLHDVPEGPAEPPVAEPVAEPQDRQGREAAALLRTYRRLAREDDLGRMLTQVIDAAMELCDAERGAIALLPAAPGGERLLVARELAGGAGANFSRSVIDRVLEQGAPILSVDAITDDRFGQSRSISHLNLRSVLAVPVVHGGATLGALYVDHRLRRGAWGEADLARLEGFAELAALAIDHLRAVAALAARGRELQALLEERELEIRGLREAVRAPERRGYRGMVGGTGAIQAVFRLVDRLADSDVPVVIYGESGTGKELVARAIHDGGPRKSRPFVAENCGAIPETLLEGVLFGHAKGAYTGAQRAAPGLFEAADGGTLFLDEIGEMSPAMQTKLLRVLQEGEVRRVGDTAVRKIDVRVIAASNRDLDAMVAAGQFRKDLLYRIRVVKVELPPLRARTEDLPPLIEHFLGKYDRGRRLVVSAAAVRALVRYAWPGNIRELENEVQRWVALCESRVEVEDLSPAIREPAGGGEPAPDDLRLKPRVERLERELIERALKSAGGNQTKAAALLGLSRFGLQKKLRRLEGGEGAEDDE